MTKTNRSNDGQWTKGKSGNPAGRPPGSRNQATLAMESLLEGETERLTKKAVELALDGDVAALRLCLERLVPARKDRSIQLSLPPTRTVQEIPAAIAVIMAAIGDGQITPGEGEVLAGILSRMTDIIPKHCWLRRRRKTSRS